MSAETPTVSVIVPNYNHRKYLPQRLESILAQTYTDFELLYLDDASTDGSEEVFRSYADDPRIRPYHNLVNTGNPFAQWNKGVGLARGKYVWIAEADDSADPRFLETLVPILDANPDIGIAYSQSDEVDENDAVIGSCEVYTEKLDREHWADSYVADGRTEASRYMIQGNTIPNASAVLFRRDVYERVGGANPEFRLCGDWYLWVRMLQVSDVAFNRQHLNSFRKHDENVRTAQVRTGRNYLESFKVMHYIKSAFNPERAVIGGVCSTMAKKSMQHFFDGTIMPNQMLKIVVAGLKVERRLAGYLLSAAADQVYARIRKFFRRPGNGQSTSDR